MMMSAISSQLIIVDIQERLAPAMHEPAETIANGSKLAQAARQLGIPVTITQQYPKGIGPTVAAVREAAGNDAVVLDKMSFSCARDDAIAARFGTLAQGGRRQAVLCGVEAHVCVLQTALDLVERGYATAVVADAISSRTPVSKELALRRMEQAGVSVVSLEMVLFEWLERAGTPQFKALLGLVK